MFFSARTLRWSFEGILAARRAQRNASLVLVFRYLKNNVRFGSRSFEGPHDRICPQHRLRELESMDQETVLIGGSNGRLEFRI